jgi:alkaline phosphatase
MVERALDRLSRDPDGFVLFVEDEIFDLLGHGAAPDRAWISAAMPPQALAFDAAVGVAIDWTLRHSSFDETLIVVTADHETGGYVFDPVLGPASGELLAGGFHTRTPVEVRALGPGSEALPHVTGHVDTHALLLGILE